MFRVLLVIACITSAYTTYRGYDGYASYISQKMEHGGHDEDTIHESADSPDITRQRPFQAQQQYDPIEANNLSNYDAPRFIKSYKPVADNPAHSLKLAHSIAVHRPSQTMGYSNPEFRDHNNRPSQDQVFRSPIGMIYHGPSQAGLRSQHKTEPQSPSLAGHRGQTQTDIYSHPQTGHHNHPQTLEHSHPQTGHHNHPQTLDHSHPQTGHHNHPQTLGHSHPQTGHHNHPQTLDHSHPQTGSHSYPQARHRSHLQTEHFNIPDYHADHDSNSGNKLGHRYESKEQHAEEQHHNLDLDDAEEDYNEIHNADDDAGKDFSFSMPYEFGYEMEDHKGNKQHRKESSDFKGVVRGSYGYIDEYGLYRTVDYIADKNGFRAQVKTNEPGTDEVDPAHVHMMVNE